MTQRMDPNTQVRIDVEGDPEPTIMRLGDLYGSCSWRETGDDLDLETHLRATGSRREAGWRVITLLEAGR